MSPMRYTDLLLCFIIKAVALGLQILCPLSVCCVVKVVLILDPISPRMPYLEQTHTQTQTHLQCNVKKLNRNKKYKYT